MSIMRHQIRANEETYFYFIERIKYNCSFNRSSYRGKMDSWQIVALLFTELLR